jgi:hypothetical protein
VLNLSSTVATTIPATIQIMFTIKLVGDAVKLPKGIIITVAIITMPIIAWNDTEK